jgi:hypothetical protein
VKQAALAAALVRAEDRLRARGWTGAQAFDALLPALEARLAPGGAGDLGVDPEIAAIAAELPLAGPDIDLLGLAYERFFAAP